MTKPLSPTRADRLLRILQRNAAKLRGAGMANLVIEDEEFRGDSIVLGGEKLLNFGLCSYLSLGDDQRLKEAARDAIDRYGTAYSSSITYTSVPYYADLRERLGRVFDAHAIVTGTTTLGHLSAIPVLIGSEDVVLMDMQTHTSVVTATHGLLARGMAVNSLPHSDMGALEVALQNVQDGRRVWYLTDGVFSMHGDTSPAEQIAALMQRHPRLHVYVDDAHGFGWTGRHGRGHFLSRIDWNERIVVAVGLSKAFGSLGGAIATTNEEFAELITLCGPALMFGGPVPPASMAASVAAADILLSDEFLDLEAELMHRIRLVNRFSEEIGLPLFSYDETPLWFHDVGEMDDMLALLTAMREAGYFLNGSAFPAVPRGHAGIRFTVTVDNTPEQIESMLLCLNEKRLELFGQTGFVIDTHEASERSDQVGK